MLVKIYSLEPGTSKGGHKGVNIPLTPNKFTPKSFEEKITPKHLKSLNENFKALRVMVHNYYLPYIFTQRINLERGGNLMYWYCINLEDILVLKKIL